MSEERRGLRFPFEASAEVFVGNSTQSISVRVTELSLRGCFLETSEQIPAQLVRVKIFHANEYFESSAEVIYSRTDGVGVLFNDTNPVFRVILQKWVLAAMDRRLAPQV